MDVAAWLRELGLERYLRAFVDNEIDADILPTLTADDLKDLGVTVIGDRRRLLNAIAALAEAGNASELTPARAGPEESVDAAGASVRSEAERRQLTVMFVDLVGSTELAARLDPEDLGEVIRSFQGACAGAVERFEGHVAKYMGDGVLAYFGYPTAHEDDAERAVRAGLAVVAATGELAAPGGDPLAVRIGIATGLVMVGDLIGEGEAQEQTVVGETPNLAARLQALAEPDSVVVAPATRHLLGDLFELADLGAHELKGFAQPMHAYRVVGAGGAESRFEAFHVARLTPLVGRDEELQLLLSRWHRAQGGEGQVVLLSGEPGIGKSRLSRALLEALVDDPHVRLRYQCSPHHTSSALHPVIEQLERAAGFSPGDPPDTKLNKLEALLGQSSEQVSGAAALLAPLLSIPTGERYPSQGLTPQRQKQLTLEALVEQLEGLAAERPVLFVLEDAHWIDPTTLELFELIIDRAQPTAVLVLITCRPEFQPSWSGYPHITLLSLNRLGQRQAAEIIDRLTDGKALPGEVLEQIVAKTDGVPLFVEELTKTVLESGFLRETEAGYVLDAPLPGLAVPATLHDSLMARLDRLGPVKEIAQIGAAIGRTFAHTLVAAVAGRDEAELGLALDQLVASELIFRRGSPPDATYSFKHALVQDAAYECLLRSRRRQLHARIAQALEEGFPDVVEAEPEILAHHHSAAGQTEAALGHWVEAGRRAAERSANREAIEHLSKARSSLEALPAGPARDRRELDLLTILGPAVLAIEGFTATEVEPIYMRVRELCLELDDRDQGLATFQALRTLYMVKGRLADARAMGEELLALGGCYDADSYQFEGHRALGIVEVQSGCLVRGHDHLKRALTFYDPTRLGTFAQLPNGHPGVIALAYLGTILDLLGFAEQAERRRRDAFELAHELAHPFSLAQALYISSLADVLCHRVRAAEENANAALAVTREQGFEGWRGVGLGVLGWARALQGHPESGVADIRRGLAGVERMGATLFEGDILVKLAEVLSHTGEIREGLSLLARHRRLVTDTGLALYDAMARRVEGELRLKLAEPEPEAAEACFREALQIARRQEVKPLELQAAMALARLWRDQGKPVEGHDLLAPIYAWFTEGFDTPDLIEAKALLGELA